MHVSGIGYFIFFGCVTLYRFFIVRAARLASAVMLYIPLLLILPGYYQLAVCQLNGTQCSQDELDIPHLPATLFIRTVRDEYIHLHLHTAHTRNSTRIPTSIPKPSCHPPTFNPAHDH